MIESRLDPSQDGLSHLARVKEHTVAEIAEMFRFLAEEGKARSASAVLRIVVEQSHGRRIFPKGPIALFSVIGAFALIESTLIPDVSPYHERVEGLIFFLLVAQMSLGVSIWKHQQRHRRYRTQLAEIRRLALATLVMIVGREGFVPGKLTNEARRTFEALRRTDPQAWDDVAKVILETLL